MKSIASLLFWFLISVFSSLRITEMLHKEVGPWDLFDKFRAWLGVIDFDDLPERDQLEICMELGLTSDSEEDEFPLYDVRTFIGKLFDCVKCLSIWVAFVHSIILYRNTKYAKSLIPITTCAISAMVIEINDKK